MEARFVELPEFTMVGLEYLGANENGEISKVWEQFNARYQEIDNAVVDECFGVCDCAGEEGKLLYIAGAKVTKLGYIPQGMIAKVIPAAKYAVFTHQGPVSELPKTFDKIYGTWLPQSGYTRGAGPDIEYYDSRFTQGPDSQLDIYIPIT